MCNRFQTEVKVGGYLILKSFEAPCAPSKEKKVSFLQLQNMKEGEEIYSEKGGLGQTFLRKENGCINLYAKYVGGFRHGLEKFISNITFIS